MCIPEKILCLEPLTLADFFRLHPDSPQTVEDEADPDLRNTVLQGPLRIGEEDPPPAELLRVHVIVPGAHSHHGPEVRPRGVKEVRVHPEEGGAEEDLVAADAGGHLVNHQGLGHLTTGGQPREYRGREIKGHENARPHV